MKSKDFTGTAQYLYLGASEDGASHSVVQVKGTFSATVTFQGSMDGGTTWNTIGGTNLNDGTLNTAASAAGMWRIDTTGLQLARLNCTTYVSGTLTAMASSTGG